MRSVQVFQVIQNKRIARDTYLLQLGGDTTGLERPGQFVNVELPGSYLRRPLSVCRVTPGELTLMYKVLGAGTDRLAQIEGCPSLSVLSGLGNGFTVPRGIEKPLVVGGGIGVAPLLALVEELLAAGLMPRVIFGFGSEDEVALVDQIEELGVPVTICTVDGSAGVRGFVTDAMVQSCDETLEKTPWDYVYACGPTPMLKAVHKVAGSPGQYSMEERMACGFGACMGCVIQTSNGLKRVCKEGPVFEETELPW